MASGIAFQAVLSMFLVTYIKFIIFWNISCYTFCGLNSANIYSEHFFVITFKGVFFFYYLDIVKDNMTCVRKNWCFSINQ